MTLSDLSRDFHRWNEKNRAPGTGKNYRRLIDRWITHVGNVDCLILKKHHLISWAQTWHEIQAVQRLFSWAVNVAELLERNPFATVKRPALGVRRRILDKPVLARMLWKSKQDFRRFMIAARETLARPQEVRAFAWSDLWWPERPAGLVAALQSGKVLIVLDEYKGQGRRSDTTMARVIPVSPRLARMLVRLVQRGCSMEGHIFTTAAGRPWTNNTVRLRMRSLRDRLNLGRDKRGERVVTYTLRHTIATWYTAAGVRDKTLAELMGHTSTRTTARYQHLSADHLRAAMDQFHSQGRRKLG